MIKINVYGVNISVHTNNISLKESIISYYGNFITNKDDFVADIDVNIKKCSYLSKYPSLGVDEKFVTIGDGIKINFEEKKYYFEDREIRGVISFSTDGKVNITGYLKPRKIHHIANIILQGFSRISKFYNRFLIKTLIHDMVFIFLEKERGFNLLHATAITNEKKTFVLTGLGGSGKSTIAAYFHEKKGYQILADNYVLIKDNLVYPFPELTRVTDKTFSLLNLKGGKKADGIKRYIPQGNKTLSDNYPIDKIIICSYGKSFDFQNIADKKTAFEMLFSINNYTKEFPEYLNLSLLSFLNEYNTGFDRIHNLKKLVDLNDTYFLVNSKDDLHHLECLDV